MRLPGGHCTRTSNVSQQAMVVHVSSSNSCPLTSQYPKMLFVEEIASNNSETSLDSILRSLGLHSTAWSFSR